MSTSSTVSQIVLAAKQEALQQGIATELGRMGKGEITGEQFASRRAALENAYNVWYAGFVKNRGATSTEASQVRGAYAAQQAQATEATAAQLLRDVVSGKISQSKYQSQIQRLEVGHKTRVGQILGGTYDVFHYGSPIDYRYNIKEENAPQQTEAEVEQARDEYGAQQAQLMTEQKGFSVKYDPLKNVLFWSQQDEDKYYADRDPYERDKQHRERERRWTDAVTQYRESPQYKKDRFENIREMEKDWATKYESVMGIQTKPRAFNLKDAIETTILRGGKQKFVFQMDDLFPTVSLAEEGGKILYDIYEKPFVDVSDDLRSKSVEMKDKDALLSSLGYRAGAMAFDVATWSLRPFQKLKVATQFGGLLVSDKQRMAVAEGIKQDPIGFGVDVATALGTSYLLHKTPTLLEEKLLPKIGEFAKGFPGLRDIYYARKYGVPNLSLEEFQLNTDTLTRYNTPFDNIRNAFNIFREYTEAPTYNPNIPYIDNQLVTDLRSTTMYSIPPPSKTSMKNWFTLTSKAIKDDFNIAPYDLPQLITDQRAMGMYSVPVNTVKLKNWLKLTARDIALDFNIVPHDVPQIVSDIGAASMFSAPQGPTGATLRNLLRYTSKAIKEDFNVAPHDVPQLVTDIRSTTMYSMPSPPEVKFLGLKGIDLNLEFYKELWASAKARKLELGISPEKLQQMVTNVKQANIDQKLIGGLKSLLDTKYTYEPVKPEGSNTNQIITLLIKDSSKEARYKTSTEWFLETPYIPLPNAPTMLKTKKRTEITLDILQTSVFDLKFNQLIEANIKTDLIKEQLQEVKTDLTIAPKYRETERLYLSIGSTTKNIVDVKPKTLNEPKPDLKTDQLLKIDQTNYQETVLDVKIGNKLTTRQDQILSQIPKSIQKTNLKNEALFILPNKIKEKGSRKRRKKDPFGWEMRKYPVLSPDEMLSLGKDKKSTKGLFVESKSKKKGKSELWA